MTATVDLYQLTIGGKVWRMTSADSDQIYAGHRYVATPIGRSGVTIKNELSKANLDIKLPLTHELALLLLGSWLERVAILTVFRKRPSGVDVIWKGRLTSTPPDATHVKLIFESIFTSMRRPGLRARYQKTCRHPLYGRGCWLNPDDFAYAATLSAYSGRVLTVPAAAAQIDGFFDGGMVKAPDGTLTYISQHVGDQLTMNRISGALQTAFLASGPGLAITIYPGCNHSYAQCAAKFANDGNYGGFDYIPTKNPTGGSSIV